MTTPAARWERVQELLHDALDRDPSERTAWLTEACAGDDALVAEVASLVAAHHGNGPLGEAAEALRLYGVAAEHIGPYRILRPLGRGGMGAVYLAERTAGDITQLVALKLLPPELVTGPMVERFAVERRILARLEHAGIARLIDAGTTPEGQPYFAMEFVEGTDLVTWARKRRLRIAERLRLMLSVCEAAEYAHRQLVVHRDLKPNNILVTEDGRPKLLDFGIAKLLDPDQVGTATRTLHWLTPDYASPEQVRGEPVGTGGDVYSLGVLLYELLCDRRPFDLDALSPAAIEQVICHMPPPKPSDRAESRAVGRLLRGDLDTIVLKALAKSPERRYSTVRELDDDLRRYLDSEPVRARPDTFAYRTSMFVRRHQAAVAAAAIVFASLVFGLATASWQASEARQARDRAETERQAAQDVSSFMVGLFESSDPTSARGDTAVAWAIMRRGVARADALASQPIAQARILDALGMVYVNLGRYDSAYALVERALTLRRAALPPYHADIATSLRHRGRVERALARYQDAEESYLAAASVQHRDPDADPAAMIATLDDLGFLMPYLGREDEAERYRRLALDQTRRLFPDDQKQIAERTILLSGNLRRRGLYDESIGLVREALELRRRAAGPEALETASAMLILGDVLRDRGTELVQVESLYREGIRLARAALPPGDPRVVHGLASLSDFLLDGGRVAEAERLAREVLDIRTRVLGPVHPSVAESMEALASVIAAAGRHREAERMHRGALEMWIRMVGSDHVAVASSKASLANLLDVAGRSAEAEALMRESIETRIRVLRPGHVLIGVSLRDLGVILMDEWKLAEAESTLVRGLAILRAHQRVTHRDVREAHRHLAQLYTRMERPADAARHRALSGG